MTFSFHGGPLDGQRTRFEGKPWWDGIVVVFIRHGGQTQTGHYTLQHDKDHISFWFGYDLDHFLALEQVSFLDIV